MRDIDIYHVDATPSVTSKLININGKWTSIINCSIVKAHGLSNILLFQGNIKLKTLKLIDISISNQSNL
jgi:hypothetical protein